MNLSLEEMLKFAENAFLSERKKGAVDDSICAKYMDVLHAGAVNGFDVREKAEKLYKYAYRSDKLRNGLINAYIMLMIKYDMFWEMGYVFRNYYIGTRLLDDDDVSYYLRYALEFGAGYISSDNKVFYTTLAIVDLGDARGITNDREYHCALSPVKKEINRYLGDNADGALDDILLSIKDRTVSDEIYVGSIKNAIHIFKLANKKRIANERTYLSLMQILEAIPTHINVSVFAFDLYTQARAN